MKIWKPKYYTEYSDWHIHATVVNRIVHLLRPTVFVELGVKYGQSFFSIVESMIEAPTDEKVKLGETKQTALAIDPTMQPEFLAQTVDGVIECFFIEDTAVASAHATAAGAYELDPVDLLHIDSYHQYTTVKADFEAWLPLMSKKGIVLFHDSASILPSNGVSQLLRELSEDYGILNFTDGEGLAVLFMPEALYLLPAIDAIKEDWITNNR